MLRNQNTADHISQPNPPPPPPPPYSPSPLSPQSHTVDQFWSFSLSVELFLWKCDSGCVNLGKFIDFLISYLDTPERSWTDRHTQRMEVLYSYVVLHFCESLLWFYSNKNVPHDIIGRSKFLKIEMFSLNRMERELHLNALTSKKHS